MILKLYTYIMHAIKLAPIELGCIYLFHKGDSNTNMFFKQVCQ